MALVLPKNESSSYEACPEGNHVACCYAIVDLGTHEESFDGQPPKSKRKVFIQWEICSESRQDGSCFRIGDFYALSSHQKSNFRKDLESWRGKAFSDEDFGNFRLQKLLGKPCMLNVVQIEKDGKTKSKIASIASMPKGMPSPKLSEPALFASLEPDEFDATAYERVPDFLKEDITKSPEWGALHTGRGPAMPYSNEEADDIPF